MKKLLVILSIVPLLILLGACSKSEKGNIEEKINSVSKEYKKDSLKSAKESAKDLVDALEDSIESNNEKEEGKFDYSSLSEVLEMESHRRVQWSLGVAMEEEDVEIIDTEKVVDKLKSTEKINGFDSPKVMGSVKEFSLYCDNLGKFLPLQGESDISPVKPFSDNGKRGIIFSGVVSTSIYNTIQTDAKERVSRVISSCLLPQMGGIHESMKDASLDFYGITFFYGAKDFTDDYATADGEMTAIVLPVEDVKEYSEGKITDKELIKRSRVYMSDKDMSTGYRKVGVRL